MKDVKKVVSTLLRKGAQRINDAVVRSCGISADGSWVILNLTQQLPMFVQKTNDAGVVEFQEGLSNRLFVSMISLSAVLGNNPELASVRSLILSSDENLKDILSYATIDIVGERVHEGEDYVNPFSESEEPREVRRDSIYYHLISIKIGGVGEELLETLREAKRQFRKEQALIALKERAASRKRGAVASRPRPRRVEVEDDEDSGEA